ncbi:ThuA domain-containing protein [Paenibacillus herberti]|uniref:Glycosyl hydrolase n=1 Tax=Paenibacillus herberti TaxID=1619309 RepID=A0A229NUP2_9BACL|nr:ThuA domain-containing protein [Paenibacillus herberti]OXM13616.1 glycosyl hydrolase [Paenibacillus herberti]
MVIEVGRGGIAYVPDAGSTAAWGSTAEVLRQAEPSSERKGMWRGSRNMAGFGALVLGDKEEANHPLKARQESLGSILNDDFDIQSTDCYDTLAEGMPADQSLIIACSDRWSQPLTDDQANGLARFVEGGGGLLLLHCGISIASHPRLENLIGASCSEHPPHTRLSFHPVIGKGGIHPAVQDIEPFELTDEPYRYSFLPSTDREVILEYLLDGRRYPAAWVHRTGQGRIVTLMPGHNRDSLQHPQIRRLIRSCSMWASGRI